MEAQKQELMMKLAAAQAETESSNQIPKMKMTLEGAETQASNLGPKMKLVRGRAETKASPFLKSEPPARSIGMVDKSGTSCDTSKIYRGYIKPSCCADHARRHDETFQKILDMTMLGAHDKEGRQEVIFKDFKAICEHIEALLGYPTDKLYFIKLRLALYLYDPTVRSFLVGFYQKSVMPNVGYRIAAGAVETFVSYLIPNVDNDDVMKELMDLLEEMYAYENFSEAFSNAKSMAGRETSASKTLKKMGLLHRGSEQVVEAMMK